MQVVNIMEVSRLCSTAQGLSQIQQGLSRGLAAARRDVELECAEVLDDEGHRWFDTEQGLFVGDDEDDREFREQLKESVRFLEDFGRIEHHPVHTHWIRFELGA